MLAAVLTDGLDAVEAAIREALDAGAASDEVILNILARYREPASERPLDVVVDLKLSHPPMAVRWSRIFGQGVKLLPT